MVLLLALVCFGSLSFKTVDIYIYMEGVLSDRPRFTNFWWVPQFENIQEPKSITFYVT